MNAVGEQVRLDGGAGQLEGVDEENAVLRADDRVVEAFKEKNGQGVRGHVFLSGEEGLEVLELAAVVVLEQVAVGAGGRHGYRVHREDGVPQGQQGWTRVLPVDLVVGWEIEVGGVVEGEGAG